MPWRGDKLWPGSDAGMKMASVLTLTYMGDVVLLIDGLDGEMLLQSLERSLDCVITDGRLHGFSINLDEGKTKGVIVLAGALRGRGSARCRWRRVRGGTSLRATHRGSREEIEGGGSAAAAAMDSRSDGECTCSRCLDTTRKSMRRPTASPVAQGRHTCMDSTFRDIGCVVRGNEFGTTVTAQRPTRQTCHGGQSHRTESLHTIPSCVWLCTCRRQARCST